MATLRGRKKRRASLPVVSQKGKVGKGCEWPRRNTLMSGCSRHKDDCRLRTGIHLIAAVRVSATDSDELVGEWSLLRNGIHGCGETPMVSGNGKPRARRTDFFGFRSSVDPPAIWSRHTVTVPRNAGLLGRLTRHSGRLCDGLKLAKTRRIPHL
jgi:hypothetical protein